MISGGKIIITYKNGRYSKLRIQNKDIDYNYAKRIYDEISDSWNKCN